MEHFSTSMIAQIQEPKDSTTSFKVCCLVLTSFSLLTKLYGLNKSWFEDSAEPEPESELIQVFRASQIV